MHVCTLLDLKTTNNILQCAFPKTITCTCVEFEGKGFPSGAQQSHQGIIDKRSCRCRRALVMPLISVQALTSETLGRFFSLNYYYLSLLFLLFIAKG